jgi:hypothetical protein
MKLLCGLAISLIAARALPAADAPLTSGAPTVVTFDNDPTGQPPSTFEPSTTQQGPSIKPLQTPPRHSMPLPPKHW